MNSITQNKKIEAITEKTLVVGIDIGSETHFARALTGEESSTQRNLSHSATMKQDLLLSMHG